MSICLTMFLILFLTLSCLSASEINGNNSKENIESTNQILENQTICNYSKEILYENATVSDSRPDTVEGNHDSSPKINRENSNETILKDDNLIETSISAENLTMKRFDESLFVVKVKCSDESIIGKYIQIIINNKTYWRPINNKYEANMTIYFNIGNYTADCYFNYSRFTPSRCRAFIQVNDNKLKSYAISNNIEMYYQDGSSYLFKLQDENGNPLINKTVYININNRTYYKKTDIQGIASLTINYAPGNYTIYGTYRGDYNHTGTNTTNTIIIHPYNTKITSSNITMYYANGTKLVGKLTDEENIEIRNAYINILIGERTYYRKTNDTGEFNLSLNLRAGEYNGIILFKGSRGYLPSNITVNIKILNISSRISAYNISGEYGDNLTLNAHIVNQNGEDIINGYVKVYINDRTYWRKTNTTGDINISLSSLYVGYYDAIIVFSGSNGVSPSNETVVIEIKPKDIMIVSLGATIKRNGTYKVEVIDSKGRKVKRCPLTFKINNRTYYRYSDKNGIGSITINLSNNLYDVEVKTSKNYNSNTLYETIDIIK